MAVDVYKFRDVVRRVIGPADERLRVLSASNFYTKDPAGTGSMLGFQSLLVRPLSTSAPDLGQGDQVTLLDTDVVLVAYAEDVP